MNLSIIGSESSFLSYSDNAMASSANAVDKAKVATLESENEKLQEEVKELTSQNQSLQGQIAQAKAAIKVDISDNTSVAQSRELNEKTKEFSTTNNINYANESANFSKQNIVAQEGSIVTAQANSSPTAVQRLTSS